MEERSAKVSMSSGVDGGDGGRGSATDNSPVAGTGADTDTGAGTDTKRSPFRRYEAALRGSFGQWHSGSTPAPSGTAT